MSSAGRLMALAIVLLLGAVALYAMVDWPAILEAGSERVHMLNRAVYGVLNLSLFWGLAVPGLLLAAAGYRFAVARSGRAVIVWKLFAFFTLWAIGSFAFFFATFLAWAGGGGGLALLVPSLVACLGYILLGLGFVFSTLARS